MPKKTVALAVVPTARTVLRAAKLLVSALLAAATLVVVADHAGAQEIDPSIADTDGYVPIYTVCFGSDSNEPYVPVARTTLGRVTMGTRALLTCIRNRKMMRLTTRSSSAIARVSVAMDSSMSPERS